MENISINVNTLARQLQKEVPSLVLGNALEIIAKAAGYGNYRTLKALANKYDLTQSKLHLARAQAMREAALTFELYDDATMKNDHMLDSSECAAIVEVLAQREEKIASDLQFEALNKLSTSKKKNNSENHITTLCVLPMREHELSGFSDEDAKAQYPEYLNARYETTVNILGKLDARHAPVIEVVVKPAGLPDAIAQVGDCLSFFVEINGGVPCIHISNDVMGNQMMAVFATREGLLVRESEGKFIHMNRTSYEDSPVLERVASENAKSYNCQAWVIHNDLASLNDCEPLPAPSTASPGDTPNEVVQGWEILCYKDELAFENRQFEELAPGADFRSIEEALAYLRTPSVQALVRDYEVFKLQTHDREDIVVYRASELRK